MDFCDVTAQLKIEDKKKYASIHGNMLMAIRYTSLPGINKIRDIDTMSSFQGYLKTANRNGTKVPLRQWTAGYREGSDVTMCLRQLAGMSCHYGEFQFQAQRPLITEAADVPALAANSRRTAGRLAFHGIPVGHRTRADVAGSNLNREKATKGRHYLIAQPESGSYRLRLFGMAAFMASDRALNATEVRYHILSRRIDGWRAGRARIAISRADLLWTTVGIITAG
ncbi:hypothetical protein Bbelb_042170 [Branchiostoma belcheri]|nr:hypothetical protein Bbelb_042170 [Branchiostoma belcheri]